MSKRRMHKRAVPQDSEGPSGFRGAVLIATGALMVITAVVAAVLLRAVHARQLHALFLGKEVNSPGRPGGFYSQVSYNLAAYSAEDTSVPLEVGSWETAPPDVATGASKVLRLVAPTTYRESLAPRFLTVTYPPEGAVFPPNLCAPFVEWGDLTNDLWQVTLSMPDRSRRWVMLSRARRWRIPKSVWREIVKCAGASDVTLRLRGVKRRGLWGKAFDEVHVSRQVRFRISTDHADNAIVYRLVDPPFINKKTPDLFVRDIRLDEPRAFIRARREYCINCHNFSSKTGRDGKLAIQVRYMGYKTTDHRIYLAICDLETREIIKTRLPFRLQMTTFMSWSPDGTKLVTAANQKLASVAPCVLEAQNTVQGSSDLAIYDVEAGKTFLLPGAQEPELLETFPRWTPDGKSIVYCSAPAALHPQETRYDLNVIPFDGGRGGKPQPVPGASNNGRSNIYPRFSPDGKWFSFVQAEAGSLIKSSSDIHLMPADLKGAPRRLESNAPYAADSWYSWSSNSRWIVFTTKRDDGVFARLYMTHIDDEGHASPAVRLPLIGEPLMCFNIPEFVAEVPRLDERTLFNGVRMEEEVVRIEPADPSGPRGSFGTRGVAPYD